MKKNKGFTLIELLAVIVILGIILAIVTINVIGISKKQEEKNKENVISSILTGAKRYVADNPDVIASLTSSGNLNVADVMTLVDNHYVDFDTNKYSSLYNDSLYVSVEASGTKLKYIITVDSITYNDCGLEKQPNNNTTSGNELCK